MTQINLNHAVVHELIKDMHSSITRVKTAPKELDIDNEVVIALVDQIVEMIGSRAGAASFGVFDAGPSKPQIAGDLINYCRSSSAPSKSFLNLSNDCMKALKDYAEKESLATGGYLLFADYKKRGNQFLLMAMIKQRVGITIENLKPRSIQELELSKLHQLASISFSNLKQNLAGETDKTYIRFVSPKANQSTAGYFIESIGCKAGITSAAATKKAILEINKFFNDKNISSQDRLNAKEDVLGMLQNKADSGDNITLNEIEQCLRPYFPADNADQLSGELRFRLQSEDVRIPAKFTPSTSALKQYTRFQYRSDSLKLEIERGAVKFDDSSPIYFDRNSKKLIISDSDLISKLGDAMDERE